MKLLLILTIASVLCHALNQPNDIVANDGERSLYTRDYGTNRNYERYSTQNGYETRKRKKGKKNSSSGKKNSSSGKKNISNEKTTSSGGDNKEESPEVILQPLACPGKCLDILPFSGDPSIVSVVHNECNNCDPNQKWRINKYKGDMVQIEHVNSPGQCACIVDGTGAGGDVPPCEGGVIKLGPCTYGNKHDYWSPSYGDGEPSDLSLFTFVGGRFIPSYCLEQEEVSSTMSVFTDGGVVGPPPYDYCNPPPENDPFLYANTADPFVFPEDIFMITTCLADERQCSNDWW